MHFLEICEEANETVLSADYISYLQEPGAIASYVDRTVEYAKDNDIVHVGVMVGHDPASIVAATVSERCVLKFQARLQSPCFSAATSTTPEEQRSPSCDATTSCSTAAATRRNGERRCSTRNSTRTE